jgi:hypothetical protein
MGNARNGTSKSRDLLAKEPTSNEAERGAKVVSEISPQLIFLHNIFKL